MMPVPALMLVAPAALPTPDLPRLNLPELETLIQEARQSAPDLAVVMARLERARVAARAAGAERVPRLDAVASSGRMREPGASGEPEVRSRHHAGMELSWEIDLWGRLRHAKDAATRDAEAAAEDLQGAWLLLESEIVEAFVQLRLLESAAPHHAERILTSQRTVALHEVRAEAGTGTRTAVHQARLALRQVEAESLTHRRTVLQLRHRLAQLLGRGPDWSPGPGPALDLPDLPAGLDSSAIEARADLRAAQRRMEAATIRVGEARAARLPRFTLTGAFGMTSSELRDLARDRSTGWSLLPGLSMPLLDGGRSRLRVEASQAEAQEAQALLQQTQHRALHEVAEAMDRIVEDRKALAHWAEASQDAEYLLATRQAEKQAGRIGGLPLAEADLERHGTALQVLEARRLLAQTRITLQRALGQPWFQQ